jgi:hypothetical protein
VTISSVIVRYSAVDAFNQQTSRENDATGTLKNTSNRGCPIDYLDPRCVNYLDHSQGELLSGEQIETMCRAFFEVRRETRSAHLDAALHLLRTAI